MSQRSYRSIGDVLTLLRGEFPDITISKIRFLESQGLVSPQRSPSGYRKFFDEDVERLRYVLREQRENFLPLKVIRDRLNDSNGPGVEQDGVASDDPVVGELSTNPAAPAEVLEVVQSVTVIEEVGPVMVEDENPESREAPNTEANDLGQHTPAVTPSDAPRVSDMIAALQEGPAPQPKATAPEVEPTTAPQPEPKAVSDSQIPDGQTLTAAELSASTGLSSGFINDLVDYSILKPVVVGGLTCFDAEGVAIAGVAAKFSAFGVEPRHLRQFRNTVDREMGLIEQVATPLLRQRNAEARGKAEEMVSDIQRLAGELREVLLAREIKDFLGG